MDRWLLAALANGLVAVGYVSIAIWHRLLRHRLPSLVRGTLLFQDLQARRHQA